MKRITSADWLTALRLTAPMMTKPTLPSVGVVSLGCPKNLVDAEVMLGHLQREGHEVVAGLRRAGRPRQHLRIHRPRQGGVRRDDPRAGRAQAARRDRPRRRRGLHGAEVRPGARGGDPGGRRASSGSTSSSSRPPRSPGCRRFRASRTSRSRRGSTTSARRACCRAAAGYAYLKVGEGCDNPCTFCTIPQMRGLQRSRSVESLVAEAQSLEAQGVAELVLISQDTTRYGEDLGMRRDGLARLVERAPREDLLSRGSASSTPTRRRSTSPCCG